MKRRKKATGSAMAIRCPRCDGPTGVARTAGGEGRIDRTRRCRACRFMFVTIERLPGKTAATFSGNIIKAIESDPAAALLLKQCSHEHTTPANG